MVAEDKHICLEEKSVGMSIPHISKNSDCETLGFSLAPINLEHYTIFFSRAGK